ncbi:MAG: SMI1/KNR4 family protein [Spirulinaceae cyanobacterium]
MYLDRFKSRFEELRKVFQGKRKTFQGKIISCEESQIYSLEQRCNISLPKAYKEFLLWGGLSAGGFLRDSNFLYDSFSQFLEMREIAEELLIEDDFIDLLPEDAFVFDMHQGYIFLFFRTVDGDDPPVYGYKQGDSPVLHTPTPFKKLSSSFSEFLLNALEEEARSRSTI